jgi:hypothetical protein
MENTWKHGEMWYHVDPFATVSMTIDQGMFLLQTAEIQ